MNNLEFLRSLDKVVLPRECTYFSHCTYYIPIDIKNKMVNGKYVKGWNEVPLDGFIINREMSFVERKGIIDSCLDYRKPLSDASIIYTLGDFCKPFMIKVIMPRRDAINDKNMSEEYRSELSKIYSGYGDGRHEKLPGKTNLLVFGSTQLDEISGKKVDIIYCIREQDLDWYTSLVKEELKIGNLEEFSAPSNLDRYSDFSFLLRSCILPKDKDFSRFEKIEGSSDFELEYYDDYQDLIDVYTVDGKINPLSIQDAIAMQRKFDSRYVSGKKLDLV